MGGGYNKRGAAVSQRREKQKEISERITNWFSKVTMKRADKNKGKGCSVQGKRKGRVETAGIVQLCQHSAVSQID